MFRDDGERVTAEQNGGYRGYGTLKARSWLRDGAAVTRPPDDA
jgi:hypothetical protein